MFAVTGLIGLCYMVHCLGDDENDEAVLLTHVEESTLYAGERNHCLRRQQQVPNHSQCLQGPIRDDEPGALLTEVESLHGQI